MNGRARVRRLAGLVLASLAVFSSAVSVGAAKRPRSQPVPRTPETIRRLLSEGPHEGDCGSCHSEHAAETPDAYLHALVGPDDNTLCDRCHTQAWKGGSYPDPWLYAGSAHGSGPTMVWPGPDPPARAEADASGKCVNCHDPHGWTDGAGRIPALTYRREETLCLTCHDGHPAQDQVRTDFLKPFRHPVNLTGRHTGPLESQPSDFGVTPSNRRHAECADCHNPHVSRGDPAIPEPAPAASKRLLGVSRVSVSNGPAGLAPLYTFRSGADTLSAPVAEYQLCFKCHSSWTTQPSGQTDLARMLNPNNPSYHPVEAPGRNSNVSPQAFAASWSATSMVRCADCHGSDNEARGGPHGSTYAHILRKPYDESPNTRAVTSDELCFQCHSAEVYFDPGSPESVRSASRFNAPGTAQGHAEHSAAGVPCGSCHVTHGSATLPQLLVTGRVPGLLTFTSTAAGGTCTPTCHASQSYNTNYPR